MATRERYGEPGAVDDQPAPGPPAAKVASDPAAKRRDAFVAAATCAFFADGYGNTTMSSIAQAVGGSKTTLWAYFPSKEALFAAVVDDIVDHYGAPLSINLPDKEAPDAVLRRFASVLMDTLLCTPIFDLHRLVIGEAPRFPELARLFFDRGPRKGKARLARYIQRKMETGEIRTGDASLAAQQFAALCQARVYQFDMMNMPVPERQQILSADIDAAIDTFCRAWLTNTPG